MKRLVVMIICASVLLSLLAGCTSPDNGQGTTPSQTETVSENAASEISEQSGDIEVSTPEESGDPVAARIRELNALLKDPVPQDFIKRNIASGCSYTYGRDPHRSLPDNGGALTDGNALDAETAGWVGFIGKDDIAVTLDLGSVKNDLCGASLNLRHYESTGRNIPKTCEFYVSEDGDNYVLLGVSARYPAVLNGNIVFVHAYYSPKTFSARYVKIVLKDFITVWTEIDEFCVYDIHGTAASSAAPDTYYKNDPIPADIEPEYWEESDGWDKEQNLISGLGQRIYSTVSVQEDIATAYYNTPANSKLLTNGRFGGESYGDAEYFHVTRAVGRSFVYDLGKISAVTRASVGLYVYETAGISVPDKINVYVSQNGSEWQTVASLRNDQYPYFSTKRGDIVLDFNGAYKARFVKIELVVSSHVWLDEIQVFGTKKIPAGALDVVPDSDAAISGRYNDPADIGGSENILLAYTFIPNSPSSGHVTKDEYLPYVGYVDKDGAVTDTFFDSYLFLPCVRQLSSGAYLYSSSDVPSVMTDWIDYQNDVFWEDCNVNALEQAAEEVKTALGRDTEQLKVFFTILNPNKKATSFGDVDGDGKKENMTRIEDRKKVVKWWIDSYIERFNAGNYKNLKLNGFYWYDESVGTNDTLIQETLAYAAEYVHSLGYYLIWIPYHQASGFSEWKKYGFDAANMQPNYMFHANNTVQVVYTNAELCSQYGMGVEIEMDGTALKDPEYRKRYIEYLSIGAEKGYMNAVKMYYQDGCPGLLLKCAKSTDPANRMLYDLTYKYAKRKLTFGIGEITGNEVTMQKDTYYDGVLYSGDTACAQLTVTCSPLYGKVAVSSSGTFRYTPIEGFTGEDSFEVEASDGFSSSRVKITVTVQNG